MSSEDIKFWSCNDGDEGLSYTDPDEAIEFFLDEIPVSEWPMEVEVFGYARIEPDIKSTAKDFVHRLLEYLDEEFGDPEGGYSDPTDKMIEYGEKFVESIVGDYESCSYEVVKREIIKIEDYLRYQNSESLEYWLSDELEDFKKKFPGILKEEES